MTDEELERLADLLVRVSGVRAVLLGGSRARGDHAPDSDYDLGLYCEHLLDVSGLQALAEEAAGPSATVTEPGAWGPWVNGGAWLRLGPADVDWIYRDLARVRRSWSDAKRGRFEFHFQVGHPFGVPDFAYAAEVARGVVLADTDGELRSLQKATSRYPEALGEALVEGLWEADFLVANARKAVTRADTTFVAGCLFRVVGVCAHALHGRASQWVTHEKGVVASAARLSIAPRDFGTRAHGLLAGVGSSRAQIAATVDAAESLVDATRAACAR